MGGNEDHAWTASSRKLEERKITSLYPATKVRKISSWRDSRVESPPKKKVVVDATREGGKSRPLQKPSELLPEKSQAGSTHLKAPLQACTAKRGFFDKPLWPATDGASKPAVACKQEGLGYQKGGRRGPPSSPAFKAQVLKKGGGANMGDGFGSQIFIDEAVELVSPKADLRSAVQPGYVDSDCTTEDETEAEDGDEVTCSLAEWGAGRGLTGAKQLNLTEPEVRAGVRNLPGAWPGVPLAPNSGSQSEKGGAQILPRPEGAQDEQAGVKRSGSAHCLEQGRKRRKVEGCEDPRGLAANLVPPQKVRLPQAEPAGPFGARAGLASETSKGLARGGPAVLVALPEAAHECQPGPSSAGPSSGPSNGGTSPLPTPMIEFFDRVMIERGGGHVQEVASLRGALTAGEEKQSGDGAVTAHSVQQLDVRHHESADAAVQRSSEEPASGPLQARQGPAALYPGEEVLGGEGCGVFLGGGAALLDVPPTDGRSAAPLRQDSLYSPGDEFWSEAVAFVAAVESKKQASLAEGSRGHGTAAGGRIGPAAHPPEKRDSTGGLGELVGVGEQNLDTANRADRPQIIQVGQPEAALVPNSSQSPLPVRHLAFTPPELAPHEAPSLPPPPASNPEIRESLESSQEAELRRARGPPKDSAAAAAAAALLAPARGLPKLAHSLAKAPTPLNSLATCALNTGPSLGLTFPSLAEGVHDTIEESESHAEDSISQFETQRDSGSEDGDALQGVAARGLVRGEVEMVQPASGTEQGAQLLVRGLVGTDCEANALGFPPKPAAAIPEGPHLDVGQIMESEGVASDRGGASGSVFLKRFLVGGASGHLEWGHERQPEAPNIGAQQLSTAAGLVALEPLSLVAAEGLVGNRSDFGQIHGAECEQPRRLLEGLVHGQLDRPQTAGGGFERACGEAGGQKTSQARMGPNTRAPDNQSQRGDVREADGLDFNPGASSGHVPTPVSAAAGPESEAALRFQEVGEPMLNGVNPPQPPEDTEDPIECSLGTQAGPSRQHPPPQRFGRSERHRRRLRPFKSAWWSRGPIHTAQLAL